MKYILILNAILFVAAAALFAGLPEEGGTSMRAPGPNLGAGTDVGRPVKLQP